ncbi:hypothetical protein JOM56_008539 [Amanita muscaria]
MHHKPHRPSISNTMQWLSRTATQQPSSRYTPSKPTRISEPQLIRSIELLSQPRSGALGTGATIVRTPEEALRDARVRLAPEGFDARPKKSSQKRDVRSPQQSPPLPPLPLPEEDEAIFLSETEGPPPLSKVAPLPSSAYPEEDAIEAKIAQVSVDEQVVLRNSRVCAPEDLMMLPLAFGVPPTMPPPSFEPILLSEPSSERVDPMNTIVTLETSTETYNTSLNTLLSKPSYLADYLRSLLPRRRTHSDASSMYSTASDIAARQELSSPAYIPPCRIHIFLDRPSVPYAHILTYLRSSSNRKGDQEVTLPFKERLETLLELRDEAAFLNLVGLQKLCEEELQSRQGTILIHRSYDHDSNTLGSVHSQHASVYSHHTLIERIEGDIRPHSCSSIPTPESWTEPRGKTTRHRRSPSRSPPAGWI